MSGWLVTLSIALLMGSCTGAPHVRADDPRLAEVQQRVVARDTALWLSERGYTGSGDGRVLTGVEATAVLKADPRSFREPVYEELSQPGARAVHVQLPDHPDIPTGVLHVIREVDGKLFTYSLDLGLEFHTAPNPALSSKPEWPDAAMPTALTPVQLKEKLDARESFVVVLTSPNCGFSKAAKEWFGGFVGQYKLGDRTFELGESEDPHYEPLARRLLGRPVSWPWLIIVRDGEVADRLEGLTVWTSLRFLAVNGFAEADFDWVTDYRAKPQDRRSWLRGLSVRRVLADGNFSELDLSGLVLHDGSFARSVLRGTSLRDADLRGTDFRHADLTAADLTGAQLDGVNWTGATCPDGRPNEAGPACGSRVSEAAP